MWSKIVFLRTKYPPFIQMSLVAAGTMPVTDESVPMRTMWNVWLGLTLTNVATLSSRTACSTTSGSATSERLSA
jgi:hypothetical protein